MSITIKVHLPCIYRDVLWAKSKAIHIQLVLNHSKVASNNPYRASYCSFWSYWFQWDRQAQTHYSWQAGTRRNIILYSQSKAPWNKTDRSIIKYNHITFQANDNEINTRHQGKCVSTVCSCHAIKILHLWHKRPVSLITQTQKHVTRDSLSIVEHFSSTLD